MKTPERAHLHEADGHACSSHDHSHETSGVMTVTDPVCGCPLILTPASPILSMRA